MRVLVVMLLAGCVEPIPPDATRGPIIPTLCHQDTQCTAGNVCARNEGCLPPSEIREVHVTWTVGGMPANATTCDAALDLEIQFVATSPAANPRLGFAPVPCAEGKFSIDKLPIAFTLVGLGPWGIDRLPTMPAMPAMIDDAGDAAIDLMF